MTETVDAPVTTEPEKASFFEDLVDTFVAPAKMFARREGQGIFLTIVLFTVLALVLSFAARGAMGPAMDAEIDRQVAKAMADNPGMDPAAMNAMRGVMEFSMTYFVALGMPVLFLLVALATWIVTKVFGVTMTFGNALVIATWGSLPRLVGFVAIAIQGLVMDMSGAKGLMGLTIGVGRFLDPDTTSAGLIALLGRIELFTLWATVLIAIGVSVIGKVPRAKGYAVAGVVWVMGALPALFQLATGR